MDGSVFVVMASAVISCHVMSCLVWLLDHLLGGPLRLLGHALLHIVHDDLAAMQCKVKQFYLLCGHASKVFGADERGNGRMWWMPALGRELY